MKYLITAACIAALSGCVSVADTAPTETTAAAPYGIPHVKRPNLIVADMDRSLAIYRDHGFGS